MARQSARCVLHGRFPPGAVVALVQVRDERQLRPGPADREVGREIVDADGRVEFSRGVVENGRYFAVGQVGGRPLEVRLRGRVPGDESELLEVAPVAPAERKHADGSLVDAPAEERVATAEEQAEIAAAGPAGSESQQEARAGIRRRRRAAKEQGDVGEARVDNQGENEEAS